MNKNFDGSALDADNPNPKHFFNGAHWMVVKIKKLDTIN